MDDADANAVGGDGLVEAKEAFVSDGGGGGDFLPVVVEPGVDREFFDALAALSDGFLERDDVEGRIFRELEGEFGGWGGGLPPSVEIVIENLGDLVFGGGGGGGDFCVVGEVVGKSGANDLVHREKWLGLLLGDDAARVWGEVEEEVGISPDGGVVDVDKLLGGARGFALFPEPSVEDGDVGFPWVPDEEFSFGEVGEVSDVVAHHIIPFAVVRFCGDGEDAPFRFAGGALLVSDPAAVWAFDGDHGVGLEGTDELVPSLAVVLLGRVGLFGIGSVEPDFCDGAVFAEELVKLIEEVAIVVVDVVFESGFASGGGASAGGVGCKRGGIGGDGGGLDFAAASVVTFRVFDLKEIGWGEIDAELDALFVAGLGDVEDEIAFAVAPRRGGDAVVVVAGGPEAESVVVFYDEHDHFSADLFDGFDPLGGVELGRVENFRIFFASSPFDA